MNITSENNIFGLIYTTCNVFIIKLDICSTVELHHIDIIFTLTGINKASMPNSYMLSILGGRTATLPPDRNLNDV